MVVAAAAAGTGGIASWRNASRRALALLTYPFSSAKYLYSDPETSYTLMDLSDEQVANLFP